MTTLTEGRHPVDFILSEAARMRSRDAIVVLSGEGVLQPGALVGRMVTGATVAAAVAGAGNGGNGALTLADPAFGADVKEGTYTIVIVEPASDAGNFIVEDPDGQVVGEGTVAVAFDGPIKFTLADGSNNFTAGDTLTVAVSAATEKWRSADPTNTDGSGKAAGILCYGVDATSADVAVTAIVRDAEVKIDELVYDAAVDNAAKKAIKRDELARAGIISR